MNNTTNDKLQMNKAEMQNVGNSDPNNNSLVIPSVYNNAKRGPPKNLKVHHYEALRHNAEYEEVGQSRSGPRGDTTSLPYHNISASKDGRHGFDNRAAEIDEEKSNLQDGYEVPVKRQNEGQTHDYLECF